MSGGFFRATSLEMKKKKKGQGRKERKGMMVVSYSRQMNCVPAAEAEKG